MIFNFLTSSSNKVRLQNFYWKVVKQLQFHEKYKQTPQ